MYSEKPSILKNREFLAGMIVLMVALFGFQWFPKQPDPLKNLAIFATFFMVFPIVAIRFVLRRPLQEFGWNTHEWKKGLIVSLIGWILLGACLVILVRNTYVTFDMLVPSGIQTSFGFFLIYSAYSAFFLCGMEVIFRSLLVTISKNTLGWWAILFQLGVFSVWSIARSHAPETLIAWYLLFIPPLLSGYVFFYSRSIWFSFLFSFGASILTSSIALLLL